MVNPPSSTNERCEWNRAIKGLLHAIQQRIVSMESDPANGIVHDNLLRFCLENPLIFAGLTFVGQLQVFHEPIFKFFFGVWRPSFNRRTKKVGPHLNGPLSNYQTSGVCRPQSLKLSTWPTLSEFSCLVIWRSVNLKQFMSVLWRIQNLKSCVRVGREWGGVDTFFLALKILGRVFQIANRSRVTKQFRGDTYPSSCVSCPAGSWLLSGCG